jgi:hypothetical protein
MFGNRGIYHEGWTAVTRHGVPWEMVPTGRRSFRDDVWELYDTTADPSQARDVAAHHPGTLASLRELFLVEAAKNQVFPLDDRVTERENPQLAGRLDLLGERRSITFHGRTRRLTEETAPNVKNTSHTVVADVETGDEATAGVIVAQGGRFGGWTLYCREGRACYAYNYFGMAVHTLRAEEPLAPGRHEVRLDFCYDGGGFGRGGTAVLSVDGVKVAHGTVDATVAYYFSFDETLDVGVDLGTPVSEDYPAVGNAFTGTVHSVRIDLRESDREPGDAQRSGTGPSIGDGGLHRRVMTAQ